MILKISVFYYQSLIYLRTQWATSTFESNWHCNHDRSGIRTHATEVTGTLNQRLRPLGHSALRFWRVFFPHNWILFSKIITYFRITRKTWSIFDYSREQKDSTIFDDFENLCILLQWWTKYLAKKGNSQQNLITTNNFLALLVRIEQ